MLVVSAPYVRGVVITKSDTVNIDPSGQKELTDAVYVGGAGLLVWVNEADVTCAITAPAGALLPIRAKRINSTVGGTTSATLLVALYLK